MNVTLQLLQNNENVKILFLKLLLFYLYIFLELIWFDWFIGTQLELTKDSCDSIIFTHGIFSSLYLKCK